MLELHTLGAESGRAGDGSAVYTQADVTAFAAVLSGWRVGAGRRRAPMPFDPAWHEPGPKVVLGRRYPEGPEALHAGAARPRPPSGDGALPRRQAGAPLRRRRAAARRSSSALADAYRRSDGDLAAVYRALRRAARRLGSADAAQAEDAGGIRRRRGPACWPSASAFFERADAPNPAGSVRALGQRLHAAPSPAGWSDRADDWLGPDAVWKRVEWATRVGDRAGRSSTRASSPRAASARCWAPRRRAQIERAADGSQALALLLLAPEFQRR